ncbi:MAG: DUF1275 domain-containing protein [Oscillospiraceae bacterium]|jgi:uncharacterized membrane protein YoaK (UPF0700 family)|nr:DUF1275 domain-containing protein [Oscillospiraceae bacterium]MDD3261029.1 YoaK family protein [Oscillospiraceae bacterium]
MQRAKQMSESIELGMILAISGGFMDAYSYVCRDKVFANAQTGNMLLFGINLSERNWSEALRYLLPVIFFALGIALADIVRIRYQQMTVFHWRQISVLFEAVILFGVSFISRDKNLLANSLTSLACGIQVESFRKIHGNGIATTMCIGNLRSGTQYLCDYVHTRNKLSVHKCFLYYGIIACFIVGAVLGNFLVGLLQTRAILLCALLQVAAFILMFADKEKETKRKKL